MIKSLKTQRKIRFASLIKNQLCLAFVRALGDASTTPLPFAAAPQGLGLDPGGAVAARSSLPLTVRPPFIFRAIEVRA